ncbi:putative protein N(5)-glutamine methyltransferase [Jongsikchunia kroppenstedtii]|uniref:putative protein N(5)-glutamine methyltransferase n=1 Tax=Jongsikchunia kroppenstedtii TaxID=1121721 RepID=UPI00036ACC7C|nr:putative protein N(5)-glutamine methyltransferase [Jongsikchunia kroppenstedtii]
MVEGPAVQARIAARLRAAGCVFAEDEAKILLDSASGDELETLIARRIAGEPLEILVGWAEFAGIRVAVAPGLFVPRQRSELLVRLAVAATPAGGTVADICCGTGAIAAAIARRRPDATVVAADLDPDAAACARRNLPASAQVYTGDLLAPLPRSLRGRLPVIVANAPYVPTADIALMPREAREYERMVTLDGGADGLSIQRRVLAQAVDWLTAEGTVIVETSRRQADLSMDAADAAGLRGRIEYDGESDAWAMAATRH